MSDQPLLIKRYPNRRYYARHVRQYVSLDDIDRWIREGKTVEIRDSQTHVDLTPTVLTQLLIERQPSKIGLFPSELLHFMLRADELTSEFIKNYFRDSLACLGYLRKAGAVAPFTQPLRWMQAWVEQFAPVTNADDETVPDDVQDNVPSTAVSEATVAARLRLQMADLEDRLRRLEAEAVSADTSTSHQKETPDADQSSTSSEVY